MPREFVHRSLQVARVEADHDVQYQAERTDLVFLTLLVPLAKLAAGYVPGIRKEPAQGANRAELYGVPQAVGVTPSPINVTSVVVVKEEVAQELSLFDLATVRGGLVVVEEVYRHPAMVSNSRSLPLACVFVPLFPNPLFLLDSGIRKLIFPDSVSDIERQSGANAPVVMVIFDEFPLISLLNRKREIGSKLFPNLAALAGNSYWFRNATSNNEGTLLSIPRDLDGNHSPVSPYSPSPYSGSTRETYSPSSPVPTI